MYFAYDGFTQSGNTRRFQFRGVEERAPVDLFSIEVDLLLFLQNRVSLQEGPSFCLELLTQAFSAGPVYLERLHSYLVVSEDFRPLLVARQKREAEKALRASTRSPYRKPPFRSNLQLGKQGA